MSHQSVDFLKRNIQFRIIFELNVIRLSLLTVLWEEGLSIVIFIERVGEVVVFVEMGGPPGVVFSGLLKIGVLY